MISIDNGSSVVISPSMIEGIVRASISGILETAEGHMHPADVLRIVSEISIAMRASEDAKPISTARELARFLRPLQKGYYLPF